MALDSREDRDIAILLLVVKISENLNDLTHLIDPKCAKFLLATVNSWDKTLSEIVDTLEKQEMC